MTVAKIEIDRSVMGGGHKRINAIRLDGMPLKTVRGVTVENYVGDVEVVKLEMYADVTYNDHETKETSSG